jgi:hypothetical protein
VADAYPLSLAGCFIGADIPNGDFKESCGIGKTKQN